MIRKREKGMKILALYCVTVMEAHEIVGVEWGMNRMDEWMDGRQSLAEETSM
ncbi:predicted protein [Sclerotinia sclerotiorum 1980 UF-70]|uniref:Uncharacterized protein n=1 Tax=Sclerotinia sclerotiorum (strain ATCC 18683 / 1980 / Ss-1) TaxID=665079 RepID=A7EF75_SCLS1|nr:predicted protein [Sclerotinia sclerotiorum 1980 UF-70]EDO01491.1 predicted protein [Sclerotinia sclerotiorum 1980 UF-70]